MMLLSWNAPRYKSHKVIKAAEILDYHYPTATQHLIVIDVLVGGDVIPITVRNDVFNRYVPQKGDYLVEYDDGYVSVSPRKAFLEGYTRVDE